MKLQSLSIIFIIIVFPMILILSYYISLQIDTITLYNKYNNELIDATNDAMSAFELNTANEELSNVSDSLRSIIDASTNTFINTLSTSLGLSNAHKNDIEPYIPSILYTMYDGYYIYAPTRTPIILEKTRIEPTEDPERNLITSEGAATVGEKAIDGTNRYYQEDGSLAASVPSTDDYGSLLYKVEGEDSYTTQINDDTEFNTDYVLKSYMPYSATYDNGTNTATINYTLDNFMNISAQIGDIYYTKSGYYINTTLVENFDTTWGDMGQDQLKEYCLNVNNGISIIVNGVTIEALAGATDLINEAKRKAITYYLTNTAFSNWVNDNLGFVTGNNLQTVIDFNHPENIGYSLDNMNAMYHNFQGEGQVFGVDIDPENEDSIFNNHKYNIIKNSIQYNLNLAISSYSNMFQGLTFEMPQLSDTEWEEITEKISIVSFMQGLDCGLKEFNGYAIVSSTNNEMTVIPEEIYYVKAGEFNNESTYYHRIDCETIRGENGEFISFKSKEVKYDDIYKGEEAAGEGYEYDHKNLACYDCIAQNNYTNYTDINGENKKIKLRAFLNFEQDNYEGINYPEDPTNYATSMNGYLKRAYLIAVAKERQNLYKTTAYSKNEGIQTTNVNLITWDNDISKVEVTLKYTGTTGIVGKILINGNDTGEVISTSTSSVQTVEIENNGINGNITCDAGSIEDVFIKYIYK